MYRQIPNSIRVATKARATLPKTSARSYATQYETPGTTPPPSNHTGVALTVAGVAAAAGAYWYMSHPDEATALKAKAAQDEQAMKRKAYELGDATKARTEDAKRQVQVSTDSTLKSAEARARQAAADTQDKFDAYKSSAQASLDNAQHSAEAKYDSYKAAAGKSLNDARQSTEHLYNEARSTVTGKAEEKKDEAKAGWFSWLGWGKSKSADAEKEAKILKADAEHEAKVLKAEAERKAK